MNTTSVSGKIITIIAIAAFVVATGAFAFSLTVSSENGISVASIAYAWGDGSSGGCCCGDRGGDPGGGREPDFYHPIVYNPKPSCSISTNPSNIQAGGSSTLFWGSTNATSASINKGIGSVPTHGSRGVSPSITKTYKLTVYGPGGTANCQTTVTVQPQQAPSCTISANPSSVQYGGSSTLTWNSTNATSANLTGVGSVATNGSHSVLNIYGTTTYTLNVTGPGGSTDCQTTVYTSQIPAPSCTINANPSSVQQGGTSYLSFSSTNATSANLSSVGSVGVNGNYTVYPYTTTTYILTVYGSQGQSSQCQTTVSVGTVYNQPPSCWITLTPQYGYCGSSYYNRPSTLSWGSTNVTSAYISPNIGTISSYGSQTVYTSDSNQIYTMTASGPGGTATCRTQQVYIPNPPVYPPYITLTQIPYTGLDLGIVGNCIYWFSILAFALAAGYLAVYYLPALAGIKARVPIRAMEAPMIFAKSVATSVPFVRNTIENHAGWMPQDSMTFARAENGRAPRIVITRK